MGSFLDREIKQTIILSKISKGKAERNCGEILQIKKVFNTKTDEIKSSSQRGKQIQAWVDSDCGMFLVQKKAG